jgi:Site-specific recombinases, DNA invertase Pin homologs
MRRGDAGFYRELASLRWKPDGTKPRRMRRAIGYAVVKQARSSDDARAAIAQYCSDNGLALTEVIIETHLDVQYKNFRDRPGGERVVKSFSASAVAHVVIPDLRRSFADVADVADTIRTWRQRSRHVHLLNLGGGPYSTERDRELIFLRTLDALGQIDRYTIRRFYAQGDRAGVVQGFVRGGTPYGWDRQGSILVRNDKEQRICSRIRAMKESGLSWGRIAKILNDEGVPTKRGAHWYVTTVQQAASARVPDAADDVDSLWQPEADDIRQEIQRERRRL